MPVTEPTNLAATLSITALALTSAAATGVAVYRLKSQAADGRAAPVQHRLVAAAGIGAALVYLYRAAVSHSGWQPLEAHVDGLLMIAALLAAAVLYLQSRAPMPGLSIFALPLLTVVLTWAVCASAWTLELFHIDSIWMTAHLGAVYLGTMFCAIAAVAGAMFLYVERRLRRKPPTGSSRFASLELIERQIIRTSALGFAALTAGLALGVFITVSRPGGPGPSWWLSPKIVLASTVWLTFALVMNVRHATRFRGARAAWLSIVGLVLLLATYAAPAPADQAKQAGPSTDRRAPSVGDAAPENVCRSTTMPRVGGGRCV